MMACAKTEIVLTIHKDDRRLIERLCDCIDALSGYDMERDSPLGIFRRNDGDVINLDALNFDQLGNGG